MKKIILVLILSIISTSILANSNDGLNFLNKPTANTSILKGISGPIIDDEQCEADCEYQFQVCNHRGFPWFACYTQYSQCLFGEDGCFGI